MSDSIVSAIIATVTTLAVTLVKDIFVEGARRRRQARKELLDRKLKDLYVPIYVALSGCIYPLSYILRDERAYQKLSENFHLLSEDLRQIIEASMRLSTGPDPRNPHINNSDMGAYMKLNERFEPLIKGEIEQLRRDYINCSGGRMSEWIAFIKEQFQQS
jgi:hypothetical protein